MSGLETLAEIRKKYPRLPVIMFSTLTERGAAKQSLSRRSRRSASEKPAETSRPAPPRPEPGKLPIPEFSPFSERIDVVAIGTSTGGPNALAAILPRLASDFPVPGSVRTVRAGAAALVPDE